MNVLFSFGSVMFFLYALIVFILVLGVIICLHEAGHLFFAKKAKILCHEYSIGMGPIIKQWKKEGKETAISIRAIPIGGFVSMAGEDMNEELLKVGQEIKLNLKDGMVSDIIIDNRLDGEVTGTVVSYDLYGKDGNALYIDIDNANEVLHYEVLREAHYIFNKKERVQIAPYDRCFESKKWLPRFLTILAGPMMNFVLAFLIFIIVGLASGVANVESTKIGSLTENYPATKELKAGDLIKSVNGVNVNTWTEFSAELAKHNGEEEINLVIDRNSEEKNVNLKTVIVSYRLGIANFDNDNLDKDDDYIYQKPEKGLRFSLVFDDNYVIGNAKGKSSAEKIKNGDILLGYYVDNNLVETNNWKDFIAFIDNYQGDSLTLSIKDKGDYISNVWSQKSLDDLNVGQSSKTAIGVVCSSHFSFIGGLGNAARLFWDSITTVGKTLGALFANKQIHITDLSGPVGIFAAVKRYLSTDFITFMSFVGLISANIGLVNLLPIPALDGGRILFLFYEGITRKKVSKKVETILNNVVFFLLMGLFIFITIKDIIRLF